MDEIAAWLRRQIDADLSRWRGLVANYLPNVEREGEVLLFEAREHVAGAEAKLAILDEHQPGYDFPDEACCTTCGDYPQVEYPCRTVRLLAAGFKYRLRYLPEWAPEATTPSR